MSTLTQLLTPLSYVRIRHSLKKRFDFYIPLVLSISMTGLFLVLPVNISIFGEQGLIVAVTGLIQILVGFFIASLAAVSTFQRSNLDETISGETAKLEVSVKGKIINETLTRRRFLSFLFGYLSFIALALYFTGVFSLLLVENFKILLPLFMQPAAKWAFVFAYLFGVSNMLVTTLLGLHYMTDRIHR